LFQDHRPPCHFFFGPILCRLHGSAKNPRPQCNVVAPSRFKTRIKRPKAKFVLQGSAVFYRYLYVNSPPLFTRNGTRPLAAGPRFPSPNVMYVSQTCLLNAVTVRRQLARKAISTSFNSRSDLLAVASASPIPCYTSRTPHYAPPRPGRTFQRQSPVQ